MTAVSHFHLFYCSNAQLLCWPKANRSRRAPFPFCQIVLKAQKPPKDWYSKSFYRQKMKAVWAVIKQKRMELGITQATLAKRLNVRPENIANWEHSRMLPDIRHLPKIIEFLGYNPMETTEKTNEIEGSDP